MRSTSSARGRRGSECRWLTCREPRTTKCERRGSPYNYQMSEVVPQTTSRRPRLLWTLLGAMVLVGLLPLVVSHYFLMGINRDSLETLEKKYLTRSAVSIATDIQNLITSNTQQLSKIAGSIHVMKRALPPDTDPFGYIARRGVITDYISSDSDLIALRI